MPLTEDNVTEGAGTALRSVRPTGDGRSELQSEIESLRNRAETALEISHTTGVSLLDQGLDHLTLGRTWQLSARLESARSSGLSPSSPVASSDPEPSELHPDREIPVVAESPYSQAEHHLTQSVTLLRQSGMQDHLPRGLLHRAALWREMLDRSGTAQAVRSSAATSVDQPGGLRRSATTELLTRAERDLAEAETIAERGSMLIFQIEAALERARLFLTQASANSASLRFNQIGDETAETQGTPSDWIKQAREKLDKAQRLVKQTEKSYAPHVPDWEDWDPPEYVGVFNEGDIVGYHRRDDEIERLQTEIDALDVDQ